MEDRQVSLAEARDFACETLVGFNTSPKNARLVAEAIVAAEADGLKGHGLSRLQGYGAQAKTGKADGHAVPVLSRPAPGVVKVDGKGGFAYPALEIGLEALVDVSKSQGIAMLGIHHSNHCGVAGHHVEKLAEQGLVALMFANAPASIAPWGGSRAIYGTNPIAFATPQMDRVPLVVDLSVSKVARGNIMAAAQRGDTIPEGWALDPDGNPTTNAKAGLAGTMLPMGDAKGTALALMVEILCATLVGANHSYEASSFFDGEGAPPGTGQLVLAINPAAFGRNYLARLTDLVLSVEEQDGTRLPGDRRLTNRKKAEHEGVTITASLMKALAAI
ncbi:MAG: Ldh family oxidoreductase [Hyphomicrobiales bacterium]